MDEPAPGLGWSRRQFLAGLLAAGVVSCSGDEDHRADSDRPSGTDRPTTSSSRPEPTASVPAQVRSLGELFTLGVASGDPLADSVILWTRLAPRPLEGGGMPAVDVPVRWEVAADERFRKVVGQGTATATARFGHSVHVDAQRLEADAEYWYRFRVGDVESPVGRTRTAPGAGAARRQLDFLFASCQDWRDGYWTAWPHAAQEDADLVVFLGDYIYEGGRAGVVRQHNSDEIMSLVDYRNRYGLYKGDPGLQAVHARFPWVVTWDDHEVENNYAGPVSQDRAPQPAFDQRRAAAYQAFWEHHPVRVPAPTTASLRLYRSFQWGELLDLVVLDTRQYRDEQPCDQPSDLGAPCDARSDPGRTMLGAPQKRWLQRELQRSAATWTVLANQVVMTPMPIGPVLNLDQWDGYSADRSQVLGWLGGVDNPVVITGDIHANGVADLVDEGARGGTVGTELVGTSISSDFPAALAAVAEKLIGELPQVKWVDARHRGYVRCRLTADQLRADYRMVTSTTEPKADITTTRSWVIEAGRRGAREA